MHEVWSLVELQAKSLYKSCTETVEQYAIDCEYLAYFEPKKNSKRIPKKNIYKKDIMQLFSADTTMFLKNF